MDKFQLLILLSLALFIIGIVGLAIHKNILMMLMSVEIILNAVALNLITFSKLHNNLQGTVLVFLIFVVAACEMAVAIPIILNLMRSKKVETLDVSEYNELKG